MNCKQAKTQAALLFGSDLDPTALQEVRTHLGQCVGCRQHFERLSSCLEVLQGPPRFWNADEESLWPKLSVRLASPAAGQKPHRLSGWAPTLAVAAACTAMFWVASNHWSAMQPVDPSILNPGPVQAQPIGESPRPDNEESARQKELELQRRNRVEKPSQDESGIIPFRRPGSSAIPVVPVSQPAQ